MRKLEKDKDPIFLLVRGAASYMSGSFHPPGPAYRQSGAVMADLVRIESQSSRMSPVVLQEFAISGAHVAGFSLPLLKF
jgi:hypothetical protein